MLSLAARDQLRFRSLALGRHKVRLRYRVGGSYSLSNVGSEQRTTNSSGKIRLLSRQLSSVRSPRWRITSWARPSSPMMALIAMAAAQGFSPLLGSALDSQFGWRITFLVVAAFGLALVLHYWR